MRATSQPNLCCAAVFAAGSVLLVGVGRATTRRSGPGTSAPRTRARARTVVSDRPR